MHGAGDFNASDSWFSRWQSRHGIGQSSIKGEARSCDSESAECFPRELNQFMTENNLNDHQVYNCDETALYYRLLPSKTLDVKNSDNKSGIKMNKHRVTLHFAESNSIHLLYLAAIKQYAEKKHSASVRQTNLTEFFNTMQN